jgi:hypothetical protein
MIRTYTDQDSKLENSVIKSEKEIYYHAQQEVNLRKHRYQLQHKNLRYIAKLNNDYHPFNTSNLSHADIAHNETVGMPKKKKSGLTWLRVTLSCIGTLGTVWGVPNMVLGLFGVSLFTGVALTGPGLVLALSALLIAGFVAYNCYTYDKKSATCQKELDKIKLNGIQKINQKILDEEKLMHEAALLNENLKRQHIKKIAKLDPEQEQKYKRESDNISGTTLPIDLSLPSDNNRAHPPVQAKDIKKTTAVINSILTTEQHHPVNLGLDLKKNGTINLVAEGAPDNETANIDKLPETIITPSNMFTNLTEGAKSKVVEPQPPSNIQLGYTTSLN